MLRSILIAALVVASSAHGQVRMTTKKALELVFPKCEIERRTIKLSEEQRIAIGKLCGRKFTKSVVFAYIARRDKKLVGTAWFDVHKVRSKKQLLMVAVTPRQTVDRVEVLAFAEPKRYAAPRRWLEKIRTRRLGRVRPGKDVPRITGATLTVRATTRCVDRVLAVHRTVFGEPPKHSTRARKAEGGKR